MIRPTIADVHGKVLQFINAPYVLPITSNKGRPGSYLEHLTGIPTSSECLDCVDGEVKVFPITKLKSGKTVPKETIAVTMINRADLLRDDFPSSKLHKKLSNILYIPYFREGDIITYMNPTLISLAAFPQAYAQIQKDYEDIRNADESCSSIGIYVQSRTKGPGGDAPKTRAFYLKKQFMLDLVQM